MQMMKDSRIFKYSVIINLVYVIWNILIDIWGLTSLAHVWLLWQWSTAYNQEIASGFDFTFFFRAAYDLLFNLGQIVTDPLYFQAIPFRDFPLVAVFFIPLLPLGFNVGYAVWLGINFMILCYLAVRIYQFLDQKGFGTKSNLMKIGLLLIFNPIVNSIYYFGQTIVLCTLFLWLTYEYFQKDKMLLSGIFLAVAVLIKPTTLIVLPLLLPIEWNNNHLVIDFKKGIQLFLGLIFLVLVQGLFFVLNPDVFKAWISANEGISTNSLINSASLIPYMILIYPNSLIIELLLSVSR